MPRLHRFLEEQPGIDVRVTARTRQSTAASGQSRREAESWLTDADVAVLLSGGEFPGFNVARLLALSVTPLASPRLTGGRRLAPAALRSAPLIHDDTGRLYDGRDYWDLWLEAAGMARAKLRHGAHLSHTVLALEAASEGLGVVATLPELARPQLDSGRLVAPFELRVPLAYGYYVVTAPGAEARASVRAFLDWLQRQAAPGV